jgi:hypothetical protein
MARLASRAHYMLIGANEAAPRSTCELRKLQRRLDFVHSKSEAGSTTGASRMKEPKMTEVVCPGHNLFTRTALLCRMSRAGIKILQTPHKEISAPSSALPGGSKGAGQAHAAAAFDHQRHARRRVFFRSGLEGLR